MSVLLFMNVRLVVSKERYVKGVGQCHSVLICNLHRCKFTKKFTECGSLKSD
jgi:hypothetical protein